MSEKRSFLKAAGIVGAITLLSRVLGLVRDMVLAACFGASRMGDIFLIAFELPNLVRRILGEGSLSAFVVPIFTDARNREGRERAWRFASNALTTLGLVALGITAAGILAAHPLFSIFGYGYAARADAEALALGARLTRIMFPFTTLLALSAILMGMCHSMRHFTTPALGSVMLNVSMIGAGLLFGWMPDARFAQYLAIAVVVGAALRLIVMIPPLWAAGYRYRPILELKTPYMRRLFVMMAPALFGVAVVQINITVSRAFVTLLGKGYVPCLTFSNRLVQLPLAIVASALATAILPQLAEFQSQGRTDDLRRLASFALRVVFILFLPAMAGLLVLGGPIVEVLFQRGEWTAQGTADTWWALMFYAPGLVLWGMLRILVPIFYARHDVRTPVLVGAVSMLFSVALNVLVVATPALREHLRHGGLALATTLGVLLNAAALMAILKHRGLALWDADQTTAFLKALVASAIMALAARALWVALAPAVPESPVVRPAVLGAAVCLGGAVYFAAAFALRLGELRQALEILLRRRARRG